VSGEISKFETVNMDPEDVKEVLFEHCEKESSCAKNNNLDDVVGFLESILVDETFAEMQNDFCSKHAGKSFYIFYLLIFALVHDEN
jgi:hypothetical protein